MFDATKVSQEVRPLSNTVQPQEQAKQAWHKPTVTFVPLHVTADSQGSGSDNGQFDFIP
jgi:hypothetical protein